MSQAWHTAALPLTKKFPPLADLLGDKPKPVTQAPQDMLKAMKAWASATRH